MVIFAAATAAILAYAVGKPVTAKADEIEARRESGLDRGNARLLAEGKTLPRRNLGMGKKWFVSITLPYRLDHPEVWVTAEEYDFLGTASDFSSDEVLGVTLFVLEQQPARRAHMGV